MENRKDGILEEIFIWAHLDKYVNMPWTLILSGSE